MFTESFHEKDYDGIVIKLPNWFIEINKLEEPINKLQEALENCNLSKFHGDHRNNLYEIKNYKQKKEIIKAQEEQKQLRIESEQEKFNKIISGEVKILDWEKQSIILEGDYFKVDDLEFKFDDFFTNKLNVKSSFLKSFKERVNTFDKLKDVFNQNRLFSHAIKNIDEDCIDINNITFNCCSHNPSLQINLYVLKIRTHIKKSSNGYKYATDFLKKENNTFYIENGNNKEYLHDYTKIGMKLIKQTSSSIN